MVQVADIQPGAGSSDPTDLKVFRGELYFTASNDAWGSEVWKVFANGAVALAGDIAPGAGDAHPYGFTAYGIAASPAT